MYIELQTTNTRLYNLKSYMSKYILIFVLFILNIEIIWGSMLSSLFYPVSICENNYYMEDRGRKGYFGLGEGEYEH